MDYHVFSFRDDVIINSRAFGRVGYSREKTRHIKIIRLSLTAKAKDDPNAKYLVHSSFACQNHAPTVDANERGILHTMGAGSGGPVGGVRARRHDEASPQEWS